MPTVFCFSSRLGSLQAAKKVTNFPLRAAIFFFFEHKALQCHYDSLTSPRPQSAAPQVSASLTPQSGIGLEASALPGCNHQACLWDEGAVSSHPG